MTVITGALKVEEESRRVDQRDVTKEEESEGCEVGQGLDPRLLALKMEEGSHKPRKTGDLKELEMATPDDQQENRDLALQPEGTISFQQLQ